MSLKVWDVGCRQCGKVTYDLLFSSWDAPVPACACGGERDKLIGTRQRSGQWHASERVVVYRGPGGDVKYPGRNDQPMPQRYRQQGYERVEMASLATVTAHEKSTGTMCEALHYDRNGIADRQHEQGGHYEPKVTYSNLMEP